MQKRNLFFALFFAIILILLSHLGTRMSEATPAFSFAAEEKKVFLTFDDGPSTVVTNRVLDVLKEEDVKATFFIVSDRAQSRKETLLRIAREGHTLGVHSKSHDYGKIYASEQAFRADVRACAEFIRTATGVSPTVYRFPGGERNTNLRKIVEEEGLKPIAWNAVCGDEEIAGATAEQLFLESVKTARSRNRIVLLLHDSAPHLPTAEALPKIIAHFRTQGYAFCAF